MKFAFLKQNTKVENEYLIGKKFAGQVRKFRYGNKTFVRRKFCPTKVLSDETFVRQGSNNVRELREVRKV